MLPVITTLEKALLFTFLSEESLILLCGQYEFVFMKQEPERF